MQCEKCPWTLLNAFPFTNKNCSCAECLIEELVIQLMVNKIENIRLHSWDSLTTDRNHMILVMRSLSINKLIPLNECKLGYYIIHLRIPVAAKIQETKRTSFGHRCILFMQPSVSSSGASWCKS